MLCIVAEKYIMAKALSKALIANGGLQTSTGISGKINGEDGLIVWADGHLMELAEPHEYNAKWKNWCLEDLPIFPERLEFIRVPTDTARLNIITTALKHATTVVNACDAAREGELIFDEIAAYAGLYKRKAVILRMWISDTTVMGLRTAFGHLRSHTDKPLQRLRIQGHIRSECDHLWGFNLTRYATLALREKIKIRANHISVGRVRSPVVAMIADRCRDVALHEPENYWKAELKFTNEAGEACEANLIAPPEFKYGIRDSDWGDRGALEERVTYCRTMIAQAWTVVEGESKEAREFAPELFDLTELQRAANRLWGWSAKRTERNAQILYEKYGAISYPRTDCTKLPESMEADVMRLWDQIYSGWLHNRFPDELEQLPEYEPEQGTNFAEKISDHFAIIPTSGTPPPAMNSLGNMEEPYQLWELITLRFITSWLPPAKVDASSRVFTTEFAKGEYLRALVKAAPVIEEGWLKFEDVIGSTRGFGQKLADRLKVAVLPKMEATAYMSRITMQKLKTSPPEIFSYDMILHAMVQNGLGTPATRGQQLEDAIGLNYIFEDDSGRLRITEDGEQIIAALRAHGGDMILDPKLTAFWEKQIELVGKGGERGREREAVLEDLILQIEDLGLRMTAPALVKDLVFCPKTGLLVQEVEKGWRFGGWPNLVCPRVIMKREMKASEYRDIFSSGKKGAGPYQDFESAKTGAKFSCHLVLSKDKSRFEPMFKRR